MILSLSIPSIPLIVHALTTQSIITTTLDNINRRVYTYCPINATQVTSFHGDIEGCPIVRVYVNNWNTLPLANQTAIDTMLRTKGFVDQGENPALQ